MSNELRTHEMDQLSPTGEQFVDKEADSLDELNGLDNIPDIDCTRDEEQALIKKLDIRVVGLVALLYLLSFLDRSNIGNAKIAGLMSDLKLNDDQYEWVLSAFYITYIVFQFMSLLFKLFPPHIYLAVVVLSWGIIASTQALTTSFVQLLLLRTVLGMSEAAFSGVPFYLSFFYRREELAFRTGLFISAAPLATSFASSLAWLITWAAQENSVLAPWRLLFLVEGFPSVLVAWYCYRHVADEPATAWFFNKKERRLAVARLKASSNPVGEMLKDEETGVGKRMSRRIDYREILQTLRDPKSYLTAAMFFSCNVAFSSMPVFLPTIIQEMGHSSLEAQALSAPPYLVAFFVVLWSAYASDKQKSRSSFLIFLALIAMGGYLLIFLAGVLGLPAWLRYLGLYPACVGFFSCVTLIITWTLNNQDSETKKGAGIAVLQFFGQCGPLLGTRLFPAKDGPLYLPGMAVCAGFMGTVALLALALRVVLRKENNTRLRMAPLHLGDDQEAPLVGENEKGRKGLFLFML